MEKAPTLKELLNNQKVSTTNDKAYTEFTIYRMIKFMRCH